MAKGWHRESRRHSLASKGVKTSIPKSSAMMKTNLYSSKQLFNQQNTHQEKIIHGVWNKGNSYRYILEGTGDVFRELTKPEDYSIHMGYIEEKLSRVESHIKEVEESKDWTEKEVLDSEKTYGISQLKTRIHPEDSYEYAKIHNEQKFKKLTSQWNEQNYNNQRQKDAIDLNKAMLKKDFTEAKSLIKKIRGLS